MISPKIKGMKKDGIVLDRQSGDIIECALNNDFDGVDSELEKNPELINAQRTGTGISPLMAAAGSGLSEMAEYLSKKEGIDFYLVDDFGLDALDHARFSPNIVAQITNVMYPSRSWKEPDIDLI